MSSGVKPTEECMEKYQELKQGKKYTYVLYGMSDDKKNIVVLDASTDRDFDAFTAKLPEKDCRWAVYDFQYDLGADGVRNKLAFIMWSPDEAPVRAKMLFASSKDALRRRLEGIAIELQATEFSEITKEALMERATRR